MEPRAVKGRVRRRLVIAGGAEPDAVGREVRDRDTDPRVSGELPRDLEGLDGKRS
jgi:hypothetical protein